MPKQARPSTLSPADVRRVAAQAGVDPRTVAAFIECRPQASTTRQRVAEALDVLGLAAVVKATWTKEMRPRAGERVAAPAGVLHGEDAVAAKVFLEGQDGYSPGAPRELKAWVASPEGDTAPRELAGGAGATGVLEEV